MENKRYRAVWTRYSCGQLLKDTYDESPWFEDTDDCRKWIKEALYPYGTWMCFGEEDDVIIIESEEAEEVDA